MGSSGGRGSRQGHENRRGGPKSAIPAPAGSLWVLGGSSSPCGSLLVSRSLATFAAEAGDLPSPSPAQRAPTSARARARSASQEEVRRLVPGQAAHGTQAAVAPDSGSATAALESPRDCEGIPWGFDSPDGYKSLATERRPRPRRTRRAEEKRDLLPASGTPGQGTSPPRRLWDQVGCPALRAASNQKDAAAGRARAPRNWGVAPAPLKASTHIPD